MKGDQSNPVNMPLRLSAGSGALKSYSATQLHFLMRLSNLQRQRRENINILEATDWRMRLINKSLYSTYCDCEELGIGDEARLLMQTPPERS